MLEPPHYVLINNHAFLDWFMYNMPWKDDVIPGSVGSCPMCGVAVSLAWIPRSTHAEWHSTFYFGRADES